MSGAILLAVWFGIVILIVDFLHRWERKRLLDRYFGAVDVTTEDGATVTVRVGRQKQHIPAYRSTIDAWNDAGKEE